MAPLRPIDALRTGRPYKVPRAQAPIDLHLDGNEGLEAPTDLLDNLDADLLRRYPSPARLEARIAARAGVEAARVLVTAGADDALDRACRTVLGPGQRMILPVPTFQMLARYADLVGAEIARVPWLSGPWPRQAALAAITDETRAIAIVSPNNPTGAVATAEDVIAMSKAAPNALILVDLAYAEFADQDLTAAALSCPNAVVFRTLSKAWGLAGLRVGYAMGNPEVIGWMRAIGQPYAVSGPSLRMAEAWLDRGEHEVKTFVGRVKAERNALMEVLRLLKVTALPSQANFVFGRTPRALWLRDAMAGLGIGIRAWPDTPERRDAVRITCPGDDARFSRLTSALRAALSPEALVFDMDGVLADVSRSYREAIVQTAAHFGATLTPDDIAKAKAQGHANDDWALTQHMLALRGIEVSLSQVTEVFEGLYQGTGASKGLYTRETLLPPRALLEQWASKLPLAIVTGRPRGDAQRFLSDFGLEGLFEVVVCREDAPLKPDPAPVRLALEKLGVRAAWMFGDTPDDLRAARAAGVVPIGITAPGERGEQTRRALFEAGAARVLPDLGPITELLP